MISSDNRTREQDKALTMLRLRRYRGSVIAGTGFGKSRVGVRAVKEVMVHDPRPALILVPFDHLKDRFKDEFNKRCRPSCGEYRNNLFNQTQNELPHLSRVPK